MKSIKKSEIKPCVIQFTEIRGFGKTVHAQDPEEYANMIKNITNIYDNAIQLYEGHIDKHEGKTFMATFGVPISHEEDPERAIRSALLLKQKIKDYNTSNETKLEVHSGINLGKVYAGDVGSEIKKEYTVMGDPVNIAARIMEHAQGSQILVSEEIYRITKPVFQFSEQIEFQPQGSNEVIRVFNVLDQKSGFIRRRGIEGLKSPLVGRIEELNVLKEFLKKLLEGKRSIVIITGEAGVGKSRLIEELFTYSLSLALEQAQVVNWCSGYCSPYKETSYLPFIEIIKQICNIESDDNEKDITEKVIEHIKLSAKDKIDEIYPYIANLLNIKLDARDEAKIKYLEPKALKLQTHVAISTVLRNYALQQPCVYIIDDLYLADMSTLEALKFFLETNKNLPMLLFLLSRSETAKSFCTLMEELKNKFTVHEINLRRLSTAETKQISTNLLKIPKLPAILINDIVAKSDGNPFFLEEIIKLLIAKRILYKDNEEWHASDSDAKFSIPYSIEAIIRNRFDTLNSTLRSSLEEMAVVGRNFSKNILKTFSTQWEHLDDLIDEIKNLGFISTNNDEDFAFNNASVREVIYSSIPDKRKEALHLKVGETIEALYKDRLAEFYEILFEHFSQTDKYNKTIEFGLKAAENAAKRYANHEAILFYLAVLKELNTSESNKDLKRKVLEGLGKIHSLIGKNEDAFEFFNQALKFCETSKQESDLHTLVGDTYESISVYDKSIEAYNVALGKISDGSEIEKARIKTGIARVHFEKGDHEKAHHILEDCLRTIGDSANVEARKIQATIYNRLGSTYYSIGRKQESFSYYNKALKLYEILNDIKGQGAIYNNICDYYTDRGDYYNALGSLRKSLEIDLKTGDLHGQAIVYYNMGDTYYQLGDLAAAEENFNKCLSINEETNNQLGNGYSIWGLGLIFFEKNRLKEAETHFSKALTIFCEIGSKAWQHLVMLSTAELYLTQKEYEKALQLCSNIISLAKKINEYDVVNSAKIKQSKIRIFQALENQKLAITYLQDAKENLLEVNKTIDKYGAGLETKFEIYSSLCRVNYYLGIPKETVEYSNRAHDVKKEILKFIKEEEAQSKFLNRRLYKDFEEFSKHIKM